MRYEMLPGFANVYLEDSWVLGIRSRPGVLEFDLELVLTEEHPLFRPPNSDEQYCYRNARLLFQGVTDLRWGNQDASRPAIDANGSIDFGSIDCLEPHDGMYVVVGDFGRIQVSADPPVIDYTCRW
ncbi:hypothetical protein [Agromyces archimandritae]|uniref:Uncharacterized protein n=1 Tax=Agromyces archimandritae TaxID=2781962 RepID=A0A975FLI0_9MICO|nr:hypothetical protein [Agromyces archimandritae]QTX04091.1 hypothetical protein G127AT_12430 [Agromyces archimandritae]